MVQSSAVKRRYNRYSGIYDVVEAPIERFVFAKWRRRLFSQVSGNVLEVGVGTGKNLSYYKDACRVTGVDISEGMLNRAMPGAAELDNVDLLLMDATNIGFRDDSFDFVVTTFVLCSVPDPIATLREMRRVCKPGGSIIMLEHVKSKNRLIALFEELHNPLTSWLFGFNVNRDTPGNVLRAGLTIAEDNKLALKDVFRMIKAKK